MRINKNSMMHILRSAFAVFAAAALIGCGDKTPPTGPETPGGGDEPGGGDDPEPTELVGTLKTVETAVDGVVDLGTFIAGAAVTGKVYIEFDKAAEEAVAATVITDDALVSDWVDENGKLMGTVPAAKVTVAASGKLSAAAGDTKTGECEISLATDLLEAGDYMAAVTVSAGVAKGQAVYLKFALTDKPLTPEFPMFDKFMTVFYVDVSKWLPQLGNSCINNVKETGGTDFTFYQLGNIVNLEITYLEKDAATGRALFKPSADIQYVAEHQDYLSRLRDAGQKICVTIVPSDAGFGFCDLTDDQITDFTVQVKTFLDQYAFNGISIWNREAGNTSTGQYAKLISALRKAVPNKLITLVDCGEDFGAEEVGKLVDYAWAIDNWQLDRPQRVIDPWDAELAHGHKPIPGLDPKQYGFATAATLSNPTYESFLEEVDKASEEIQTWANEGKPKSDIIVVYNFRDIAQNDWESNGATKTHLENAIRWYYRFGPRNNQYSSLNIASMNTEFRGVDGGEVNGYETLKKDWE